MSEEERLVNSLSERPLMISSLPRLKEDERGGCSFFKYAQVSGAEADVLPMYRCFFLLWDPLAAWVVTGDARPMFHMRGVVRCLRKKASSDGMCLA